MRLRSLLNAAIVAVALAAATAGCNTSGCLDNGSSLPLAGFYSSSTGAAIELDSLAIGGVDAPNDSLLLQVGTAASTVYLPLRSDRPSTAFLIHYGYEGLDSDTMNDTIWFDYTSTPYFASEECGAMYRYKIDAIAYTRHLVDSVAVTDSIITNIDAQRIKIFFRDEQP